MVTHQDFHTAVSYLSKHVGLRHVSIMSGPSRATSHQSQRPFLPMQYITHTRAPSASAVSTMPPPMRPSSQVILVRRTHSPFARQMSTRPARTAIGATQGQLPRRPVSATSSYGASRPLHYLPPDILFSKATSQPGRLSNRTPVEAGSGKPAQPQSEDFQPHLSRSGYRAFSHPVGHSNHELSLSQDKVDVDELGSQSFDQVSDLRRGPLQIDLSSPMLGSSSTQTYNDDESRPSSSNQLYSAPQTYFRPSPRSDPIISGNRILVEIQFLEPASQHDYPYTSPKIRWEFILDLWPAAKFAELCFLAAIHVERNFNVSVDREMLEARDKEGHIFDQQERVSKILSNTTTVFLTERVPATLQRRYDPSLDELHPDWTLSRASSQVPPHQGLAFTSIGPGTATNAAQLPSPTRSPLAEGPDLTNHNSPKALRKTLAQPNMTAKAAILVARPGVMTRSVTARTRKIQARGDQNQAEVVPAATEAQTTDEAARTRITAESPCMMCRRRKQRCDLSLPACGLCKQADRTCIYPRLTTAGHEAQNNNIPTTSVGRMLASTPAVQDVATQTSAKTQDIAAQTEEVTDTFKDVEMKNIAINTFTTWVDAAVQTANCDDVWLPLSQSLELISWAKHRHEEELKKAEAVLREADPSQENYQEKVHLAGKYWLDWELDLRGMCEKALETSL